ncbi:putative methylthioadenosine nucleosidase [Helianthus annuus]|nr:putative methylthioadenosine nucleosidase [Helianthus annuus]
MVVGTLSFVDSDSSSSDDEMRCAKGASIGDVYLACEVAFHDRRIPIPVFDLYGVGLRQGCWGMWMSSVVSRLSSPNDFFAF